MTQTATLEDRAYKFDAGVLASAWLAVALASSKDEARPSLNRTVLVEFYEPGVRLVATDGYVMLTAWVSEDAFEEAPDIDEAPEATIIAVDAHGRGLGLMSHLRKLAAGAEDSGVPVEVAFHVGQPPTDPTDTLTMEGLETRALIIDHPGREELALPLFEGDYPEWRGILGTHQAVATDAIALNPEIIARLAKLGKFFSGALIWRFGGPTGAALLEIGSVFGAAMPMRWPGIGGLEAEDGSDSAASTEGPESEEDGA